MTTAWRTTMEVEYKNKLQSAATETAATLNNNNNEQLYTLLYPPHPKIL